MNKNSEAVQAHWVVGLDENADQTYSLNNPRDEFSGPGDERMLVRDIVGASWKTVRFSEDNHTAYVRVYLEPYVSRNRAWLMVRGYDRVQNVLEQMFEYKHSENEKNAIYVAWLDTGEDQAGRIGLTIAPGKVGAGLAGFVRRNLDTDLLELARLGTTVLASLTTDEENTELKIPTLPQQARKFGLDCWRFPFHDAGIPESIEELHGFVERLQSAFFEGESIVIHCRGGLGRSGLVAACLLLRLGLSTNADDAIAHVRRARSPRAIETRAQERFILEYASFLESVRRR